MYLIDDRFTRLQPGTDFRGLDVALGLEPLPFLAPVPEEWRDLHDPMLVANWHTQMLRCLRDPVQVEVHPSGHRHVMVMGDAIYDISPNGMVRCFAWRHGDDGRIWLEAFPDIEVVAVNPPYRGLWMRGYANGALQRLRHDHPPSEHARCEAYANWLMAQMLAEHWKPDAAAVVRQQLAAALQLDPALQQLAATTFRPHHPHLVRLSEYNRCVLYRSRVEQVKREAPQLALLYSLLLPKLSLEMEPTQAMAAFLEQRGIGRGVWRLLVQEGTEWMRPFLAFYSNPSAMGPALAVDLLMFVQMYGTQTLVPRALLHTLLAIGGNPNRPRRDPDFAKEYQGAEDLVARLGHLYRASGAADRIRLVKMCNAILDWGLDHWAARPERSRRTIRLPGLVREARAHQRKQELVHRDRAPWATPWVLTSSEPLFEVHVLGSALALWQEAQDMRHCADKYIERCAKGQYLMVSIRPAGAAGEGRRARGRTTVGFIQNQSGFVLHTMSGFANTKVIPQAVAIVKNCLRQLNEQWARHRQRVDEVVAVHSEPPAKRGMTRGLLLSAMK